MIKTFLRITFHFHPFPLFVLTKLHFLPYFWSLSQKYEKVLKPLRCSVKRYDFLKIEKSLLVHVGQLQADVAPPSTQDSVS